MSGAVAVALSFLGLVASLLGARALWNAQKSKWTIAGSTSERAKVAGEQHAAGLRIHEKDEEAAEVRKGKDAAAELIGEIEKKAARQDPHKAIGDFHAETSKPWPPRR